MTPGAPAAGLRKGLLGGTFNPPHMAHLIVAQAVREALALDAVVLVPTSVHAFKGESAASPRDRAVMAELAVAGDPGLAVDRIEIQRGGTSYTVDTLRELVRREPDTRWHVIIGADLLEELPRWRDAETLPELADIVIVTRAGADPADPRLPFAGHSSLVPVPSIGISSTEIRRRVAAGRSIRYWVPPAVEAFIREKGLYR